MKKRIKSAKDVKIDEIIRLVGQVNANNKKFINNNAYGERESVLDKAFGGFELELIRNPKTRNIADDFHTWVEKKDKNGNVMRDKNGNVIKEYKLNITKSKVFYRQIDDGLLEDLLGSLKNLQSGKNVNKTFYSWKKRQNEIIANYKPNFIDYMQGKYPELYDALVDEKGLTDDEIFDIALEAAKDGNYRESDQLISGVAKQFNLFKKMEERVINADKYK